MDWLIASICLLLIGYLFIGINIGYEKSNGDELSILTLLAPAVMLTAQIVTIYALASQTYHPAWFVLIPVLIPSFGLLPYYFFNYLN